MAALREARAEGSDLTIRRRPFAAGERLAGPALPRGWVGVVVAGTLEMLRRGPDDREIYTGQLDEGDIVSVAGLFGLAEDGLEVRPQTSGVLWLADGPGLLRFLKARPSA